MARVRTSLMTRSSLLFSRPSNRLAPPSRSARQKLGERRRLRGARAIKSLRRWRQEFVLATGLCVLTSCAIAADEPSLQCHPRIAVVSDYISRGVTQTWGGPAVQGEVEVEHDSGVYAGAFASNVSQKEYPGAALEVDVWLGYEHELAEDRSVGVEIIGYLYPGANVSKGNQC